MAVGAILGQKPQIPQPVDTVQQGNMNAVTSNAVYEAIQAIPEPTGGKWELAQKQEFFSEWHMVVEGGTFVKITSNINQSFNDIQNLNPGQIKSSIGKKNIKGVLLPPPAFWMGGTVKGKTYIDTDSNSLCISSVYMELGESDVIMESKAWNFGDTTNTFVSCGCIARDEVIIEYFVPNEE